MRHYREHIGVVSQEPALFGTTVGNNIKFGRESVNDEEMFQAAREANAYDFIMAFPQVSLGLPRRFQRASENLGLSRHLVANGGSAARARLLLSMRTATSQ